MIRTTMQWIGERLAMKVLHLVAAKIESATELEIADVRGEMLEHVRRLQDAHGDQFVTVTRRLQEASESLGVFVIPAETDDSKSLCKSHAGENVSVARSGRGRPRKQPASSVTDTRGKPASTGAVSSQEVSS